MFRFPPNLIALLTALVALAIGPLAQAACTAANPNLLVIESTPSSAFIDHGNGTVTHTLTGLMWKKCTQGLIGAGCASGAAVSLPWDNALKAAVTDRTGGYSDWRLPNKKELESIVETCGHTPSINLELFPATPTSTYFWSSTSYSTLPFWAWVVDFKTGFSLSKDFAGDKLSGYYQRLVRNGEPFGAFDATDPDGSIFTDGFD